MNTIGLNSLESFLGTLVVSLDNSGIEVLTDICLFIIENRVAGFFTPASCKVSLMCKFTSTAQTIMDITVQHGDKLYSFEYHYDSCTFIQTEVRGSKNYSTSDPMIECRPS
jgi:hypothetical protein